MPHGSRGTWWQNLANIKKNTGIVLQLLSSCSLRPHKPLQTPRAVLVLCCLGASQNHLPPDQLPRLQGKGNHFLAQRYQAACMPCSSRKSKHGRSKNKAVNFPLKGSSRAVATMGSSMETRGSFPSLQSGQLILETLLASNGGKEGGKHLALPSSSPSWICYAERGVQLFLEMIHFPSRRNFRARRG